MKSLIPPLCLVAFAFASASYGDTGLKFSPRLLAVDANEGCAVADLNKSGHLDVVAGRNWYEGPDFTPHALRSFGDHRQYAHSNGDYLYDVDGDGWIDVIAISFFESELYWFRNPGDEGLQKGLHWERHLLVDTGYKTNEGQLFEDLNGDGVPEFIVNSWTKGVPLLAWRFVKSRKDDTTTVTMERITIGENLNGHGLGVGDINGDGRRDVLFQGGWYEQPAENPFSKPWKLHEDWQVHGSIPMLVRDLNEDGRNDIIVGLGHDFGFYWWEQLAPNSDGVTQWKKHEIDNSFSQPHALHWADLDGDGEDELITGKRKFAHNGKDPGGNEPPVLYYYKWDLDTQRFTRFTIAEGTAGTGLQIRTADLNKDGRIDIAVAGKNGTYVIFNEGE